MHIRVLLSKYRSYTPCPSAAARDSRPRRCCGGSARADARVDAASASAADGWTDAVLRTARLCITTLMLLPIDRCARFLRSARAARAAR